MKPIFQKRLKSSNKVSEISIDLSLEKVPHAILYQKPLTYPKKHHKIQVWGMHQRLCPYHGQWTAIDLLENH